MNLSDLSEALPCTVALPGISDGGAHTVADLEASGGGILTQLGVWWRFKPPSGVQARSP